MTVAVTQHRTTARARPRAGVSFRRLTPAQGRKLLDQKARRYLHMSGEEFVRAWQAGKFDQDTDRPAVMRVAMLLPFAG